MLRKLEIYEAIYNGENLEDFLLKVMHEIGRVNMDMPMQEKDYYCIVPIDVYIHYMKNNGSKMVITGVLEHELRLQENFTSIVFDTRIKIIGLRIMSSPCIHDSILLVDENGLETWQSMMKRIARLSYKKGEIHAMTSMSYL